MNVVACMPVIESVTKKSQKSGLIAVGCGVVVCALLIIFFVVLAKNQSNSDMPIIDLISSPWLKIMYVGLFVCAMISTLVSGCNGVKQIFKKMNNNFLESLCACIAVCVASFAGFGQIINHMYPIIGLVLILQLIINFVHQKSAKMARKT